MRRASSTAGDSSSPAVTKGGTLRVGGEEVEKEDGGCLISYCCDDGENKFPLIRTTFLLGTCAFYFLDVALDGWVAYEHYLASEAGTEEYATYYFHATLFFILAPLVVINLLSWALYTWGYVMYRSQSLRDFCNQYSEDLVYFQPGDDGDVQRRRPFSRKIPVEGIRVLSWPLCWKWRQRRRRRRRRESSLSDLEEMNASGEECVASSAGIQSSDLDSKPSQEQNERREAWVGTPGSEGEALSHSGDMEDITTSADAIQSNDSQLVISQHVADSASPQHGNIGKDETDIGIEFYPLDLLDTSEYVCVTIIHLLMLGFLFRVIRLIYKRKQDRYSFDRYRDISFLRLMEAFLESAPQLVLQLYIITVREDARVWYKVITPISIAVSMISLALAVADYISAAKDLHYYDPPPKHPRRPRLSWTAYFVIILWHLCMIFSRSVSFALFASVYGSAIFILIGLHYVAMVYWMYWQRAKVFTRNHGDYFDARKHACGNFGIEFIVAAFNTFFHFKIKEGRGYVTLVPFYLITFVENTIIILIWFVSKDPTVKIWYEYPGLIFVFISFFVGLAFMVYYYACCQPSKAPALEPDPLTEHPTLTSSFSRMYYHKLLRGNFFSRQWQSSRGWLFGHRPSTESSMEMIEMS